MNKSPEAKLLIVDDNEGVRHLVARWLERAGFEVREAGDGEEAVEMIRRDTPDIVLADIRMPKLDGIELARIVKSEHPGVKIILMTAYSSPQTIAQARREGVDDYLEKPFTKDQVERIAREALAASREG
ncbi:MAG: response regulator [Actinobacteria bacterium]|nr:response regulator [Actinomycetota bacterium]MDI6830923.1 response regulator [Actinomycetota bacterium]